MARNVFVQGEDLKGSPCWKCWSPCDPGHHHAALYSAYTTNVEAIQIARQNGEVHQTARIVLDRMTKDLQSALIQVRGLRRRSSWAWSAQTGRSMEGGGSH